MSAIQQEIEKALKTKQGKKEERDEYLERLVDDSLCEDEGLSDKQFNKLSKPTQKWLNVGATALDKQKPVKDFPDLEDEDEPEAETSSKKGKKKGEKKAAPFEDDEDAPEDEEEEEEEKPKKGKKGKKGKKAATVEEEEEEEEDEPAPKKDKKKAAAKKGDTKKVKKPSAISRMQFFCCKHPKMDKEKIGAKVRKEGYEFSDATLSIQYGATHKIMNILAELASE